MSRWEHLPAIPSFGRIMFLSLLTCASDSDTKCFSFQSGQQDNASHTKKSLAEGHPELGEAACLLSLQAPPPEIPLNLPWPPLTKPLHPKGDWVHLVARCAAPHPAFRSSIHKSPATCADGLLTANKCLSGSLLSDPIPRQGGDWPSFKWHKIDEVSSSPDQRSWQAPCPSPLSLYQAAPGWWT